MLLCFENALQDDRECKIAQHAGHLRVRSFRVFVKYRAVGCVSYADVKSTVQFCELGCVRQPSSEQSCKQ